MGDFNRSRLLRGALGNALVWGASWSATWVLLVAGFSVLGLLGVGEGFSLLNALGSAVRFGAAFGLIGFVAGGVFAGFTRFLYHGRRLSEISWIRFGLAGGVIGGLFVPIFLQTMNLISGDGFVAMHLLDEDIVLGALFGAIAAGLSLKLAQMGESRGGGADGGGPRGLGAPEAAYRLHPGGPGAQGVNPGGTHSLRERLSEG